jgi:hypothetical protein
MPAETSDGHHQLPAGRIARASAPIHATRPSNANTRKGIHHDSPATKKAATPTASDASTSRPNRVQPRPATASGAPSPISGQAAAIKSTNAALQSTSEAYPPCWSSSTHVASAASASATPDIISRTRSRSGSSRAVSISGLSTPAAGLMSRRP